MDVKVLDETELNSESDMIYLPICLIKGHAGFGIVDRNAN